MIYEIDVDKIIDNELTFNDYAFLQFVYNKEIKLMDIYRSLKGNFFTRDSAQELISKGYLQLKITAEGFRPSNMEVTDKFIRDFIEKPPPSKIEGEQVKDWIDEWFDLFPKGIKSGGYFVRSDKKNCLSKMEKFVKEYPEYNKDIIMQATSDYIAHMRMNNFQYMKLAHFLIIKEGNSALAAQCNYIRDRIALGLSDLEEDPAVDKFTRTLNSN